MLQKLNERIQGVVAWVIIALIAVTFTLFGIDYYLQSHQASNIKVVVNGTPITMQAFETNYRRSRAQQDLAQMTAADEKQLQQQVLNQMITNEVTVQSARKFGFEVSGDQATTAILNIPQFQEDGHFSSERYQHVLNNALFTADTFQNEVRQGMLLNQQRFAFIGDSFVLPDEVTRFVRLYMQNRDYDYLTIPASIFIKQIKVSDKDINEYYTKHQSEFMTPEQVSIDYITLSMNAIKKDLSVSDDEIQKYYEENKSNYLTPAQWQVAHILFAIPADASKEDEASVQKKADEVSLQLQKNPNQFDHFVSTVSDDKLSVADKGVLPWITAGQNELDKSLSQLNQPGQISAPVRTKYGFEIYKLIAYKPVRTKTLADVSKTIKEQLLGDMAQTQYTQALEQLSDLSYQTPDSLKPVSDALKLKIQTSAVFSRSGGNSEDKLTSNKQIVNAAFSHDVLTLSNNSEPIQLDNDSVVVLRINKHLLSKKQDLTEVKGRIEKILALNQSKLKAKEVGEQLTDPIEDVKQQELTQLHQLKWLPITQATRDNSKVDVLINDLAFNLSRPENRKGIVLENGDYVVVRLKKITDGNLDTLDKEQRDSLVQQIESSFGMMDYDLYVNAILKQSKIENP